MPLLTNCCCEDDGFDCDPSCYDIETGEYSYPVINGTPQMTIDSTPGTWYEYVISERELKQPCQEDCPNGLSQVVKTTRTRELEINGWDQLNGTYPAASELYKDLVFRNPCDSSSCRYGINSLTSYSSCTDNGPCSRCYVLIFGDHANLSGTMTYNFTTEFLGRCPGFYAGDTELNATWEIIGYAVPNWSSLNGYEGWGSPDPYFKYRVAYCLLFRRTTGDAIAGIPDEFLVSGIIDSELFPGDQIDASCSESFNTCGHFDLSSPIGSIEFLLFRFSITTELPANNNINPDNLPNCTDDPDVDNIFYAHLYRVCELFKKPRIVQASSYNPISISDSCYTDLAVPPNCQGDYSICNGEYIFNGFDSRFDLEYL